MKPGCFAVDLAFGFAGESSTAGSVTTGIGSTLSYIAAGDRACGTTLEC